MDVSTFYKSQLLDMASLIPGASPQHFLYLNDAVTRICEKSAGPARVLRSLSGVPQHGDLIDQACFYREEAPLQRLVRLSQSSVYLEGLAERPAEVVPAFRIFATASGLTIPDSFSLGPTARDQTQAYQASTFDTERTLGQLKAAYLNYVETTAFRKVSDAYVDIMDTILPSLHMLFGSLMIYGNLEPRIDVKKADVNPTLMTWFDVVDDVLKGVKVLYPWITSRIEASTEENMVRALHSDDPVGFLDVGQFQRVVSVFHAMDKGLEILVKSLAKHSHADAQQLSQAVKVILHQGSRPLFETFSRIAGEPNVLSCRLD